VTILNTHYAVGSLVQISIKV